MNLKRSGLRLAGLALILVVASGAWATSEKVLYAFHGTDGWGGGSVIVDPAGNLYGTTVNGGKMNVCPGDAGLGCGVAFQLKQSANGRWRETVLHAFDGTDGYNPNGSLILDSAGNLYGTTVHGGSLNGCTGLGCGVVFQLTPGANGQWTETVVHTFGGTDGAWPFGGLIFDSAGNLYGTASVGGNGACTGGCGVVFELTQGAGGQWTETVLYSFSGSDGEKPTAGLAFDPAGNLYGMTEVGGAHGWGTVFKLSPHVEGKWTETVLHSFDQTDGSEPGYGRLVFDASGDLYGTTPFGGPSNWGTAFKLTPRKDGKWIETVLHFFDRSKVGGGYVSSGLVFDRSGNLRGTAYEGGKYTCPSNGDIGCGVVFQLAPAANGKWTETVLHSFGKGRDGAIPGGVSLDPSAHLFGVTEDGGDLGGSCGQKFYTGCGVVFEITP